MICKHCGNPVQLRITKQQRVEVIKLHKSGYSARDIEKLTGVSFSSAARIVRESKKK